MELRVLTLNAWGGAPRWLRRRAAMARLLAELRPDCIGLQEVHARPGSADTQAHELAAGLPGYQVQYAPAWRKGQGLEEGVALLFRHRLRARASLSLIPLPGNAVDHLARRVVLACTLEVEGHRVDVLTTHLSLSPRGRTSNIEQLLPFAEELRARSGASARILLADLNTRPSSPSVRALESRGGWRDCWREAHGRRGGNTYPAPLPFRRLDAIYVQGVEVLGCEPTRRSGSDHRGVLARLQIAG
jgi:endonuclease/exonuclease/phosphatase family metal-dependent hydrolase